MEKSLSEYNIKLFITRSHVNSFSVSMPCNEPVLFISDLVSNTGFLMDLGKERIEYN